MTQKTKGGKHSGGITRKMGFVAILSIVIFIGVAAGFAVYFVNAINNPRALFNSSAPSQATTKAVALTPTPERESGIASAASTPEPTATPEPTPEYKFRQDKVNILVLGSDSAPERVEQGMNSRTDTMILVSIDFAANEINMISLPRDSYVRVNGTGDHSKLNAAFVYGGGAKREGYQYAMDTVSWMLGGVQVDYYVGFGMQAVKDVVDAMGGFEFDVDIDFIMNGRETKKGLQLMNGQKVLDYCRFRKTTNGDIGRIDRQQRILTEMFRALKSTGQIKNIPQIYEALASQLDTNLDVLQIAALAYWARDLDMSGIGKHTLQGSGLTLGGTSYWVINQDKKKELVKELFGVDITIPPGEDYASIVAKAETIAAKVNEVYQLIAPMQMDIANGVLTDPAILSAVNQGYAAMITEKEADLDMALAALSPYRLYGSHSYNGPSYGYQPSENGIFGPILMYDPETGAIFAPANPDAAG